MAETEIKKDLLGGGLHIRRTQDATPILEANKRAQADGQNDLRFGRKFASIPSVILEKWMEEGIDFRRINSCEKTRKAFMRKLNDPEFRAFRTHTGKL